MFPFFCYDCSLLTFLLLLSVFHPCFPARIIPQTETVTVITTTESHNATWHDFSRFLHAERGSQLSGMSELKTYFHRFGYLSAPRTAAPYNFTDDFDSQFESAVVLYQTKLGISVTGKLDSDTISSIMAPRCGVRDNLRSSLPPPHKTHSTRHFAYFDGRPRWVRGSPMTLTYAFSPYDTIGLLSEEEIRRAFEGAFSRWASVIPVNFVEVREYEEADIKVGFYRGDHGDGEPFDGVLGVLAHAFSPVNGRLHLDGEETWAVDFDREKSKVAVDLESVASQEIGHVLGLAHSSVKEAVMYPSLGPRTRKVDLKVDDVEGVQALYGSNPNFTFSSLWQSENSSNFALGSESRFSKWTLFFAAGLLVLFSCI